MLRLATMNKELDKPDKIDKFNRMEPFIEQQFK